MTLPNADTPLRRSAVGSIREAMVQDTVLVNDDEAERREARRRTLLQQQRQRESSIAPSIEDNETIRQCLEIYNGNKLSRDNAWSLSLIDTLSSLLERHHKSLHNFKLAGSSLEASSKVYGLRVDSNYLDAARMAAGLNARKLNEKQLNAADDDDTGADAATGGDAADGSDAGAAANATAKPKKRTRKAISTVTKNKDTLNARLETAPLQDPIFGKLNSTVGSINASNRLMHKILPTHDSELRLRTSYKFWDASDVPGEIEDYTKIVTREESYLPDQTMSAEWINRLRRYDQQLVLRPMLTGYNITDTPNPTSDKAIELPRETTEDEDFGSDHHDFYDNPKELSMAFDINAECEPMPELDALPAIMELDEHDIDELTQEEQVALRHCRGLRKNVLAIEDLRPVDNSILEYSYRPMDQISQFWAGPSYWKFKRPRGRSTFSQTQAASGSQVAAPNQRARRPLAQRRSKLLDFSQVDEGLFLPLDANNKLRKANYQKKWDPRKLVLPTKFHIENDFFFKYELAPSIKVRHTFGDPEVTDVVGPDDCSNHADALDDAELFDEEHFTADTPTTPTLGSINVTNAGLPSEEGQGDTGGGNIFNLSGRNPCNDTVLEIATEFEGAPIQVTRVVVPFAKRAKNIDMKLFRKTGLTLVQKQFRNVIPEEQMPVHLQCNEEKYAPGVASFQKLFSDYPSMLPPKMTESLTPGVALYAALHLANENNFRLFPQQDLKDFKIRQVID